MAITFFGGPPGAGKSYALVEQVIVPSVLAGRRVLTNVAGVNPDKVHDYCAARVQDPDMLGEVVLFDGNAATQPQFFPTEAISDEHTFVKGGDLIVFDEWRLYWPRRGKLPSEDLEPFLRWHRHLCDKDGVACDVAIASQLPTDVHQDFRGLIERSYKFKKLKAVGLSKAYAWDVYEGHLQPKGGAYDKGNGTYKDEITALYSSYAVAGNATELQTDKRASIIKGSLVWMGCGGLLVFVVSVYFVYRFFTTGAGMAEQPPPTVQPPPVPGVGYSALQAPPAPSTKARIVGHMLGDQGVRVIVSDKNGAIRFVSPDGFEFDGERPVAGMLDGERIIASDASPVATQQPLIPGLSK